MNKGLLYSKSILEHLHHPLKEILYPLAVNPHLFSPSPLGQPLICFLTLDLPIVDISSKRNHTLHGLF